MEKRFEIIDELRGIAILIMILFHMLYQSNLWLNVGGDLINLSLIKILKLIAQFLFISISGICSEFSKDNYKRGLVCIYSGILITLITNILIPEEAITFGILHLLGCSIIIYEILRRKLLNYNSKTLLFIFILLFIISFTMYYSGFLEKIIINIDCFNNMKEKGLLNFIGVRSSVFISSDYFPIFPWIYLFFLGGIKGKIIINNSNRKYYFNKKNEILCFLGRHSLSIYLVHIPIILLIIYPIHVILKT